MKQPKALASAKRYRWIAYSTILPIALMVAMIAIRNSDRSLLNISSPVADVLHYNFIWWRTTDRFLGYDIGSKSFRSQNIRLHTTSLERNISQAFIKTGGLADQACISPDGQQLVWVGYVSTPPSCTYQTFAEINAINIPELLIPSLRGLQIQAVGSNILALI